MGVRLTRADVGVVAMARYLIRMVSLFPEVCDLHQVSFDIDKLLRKMPSVSPPCLLALC
jgi:hypothetical protein